MRPIFETPKDLRTHICKKIKELRIAHNYSQQYISQNLYMSQNAYSEMETGKTKIDIEKVFQLAEFYKIEPYDILSTPPRKKVF
jgi:transcriptional regulator with XRE-family HTH domain